MTVEIRKPQGADSSGILGPVGSLVGKIWGPVGSVVGGALGSVLGGQKPETAGANAALNLLNRDRGNDSGDKDGAGSGGSGNAEPSQPTPLASNSTDAVKRWQQNQLNLTALNQGMKALESNPSLKQSFAPLLSDTMKRAQGGMA